MTFITARPTQMTHYRCYFLTAENRIGSFRDLESRDDAEAIMTPKPS
jgi:hypothetical protein